MKRTLILWCFCCWAVQTVQAERLTTVVYPLVAAEPAAMESFAKAVVGDEGHVVLDGQGRRLIVVTTADRHARLNEVLGVAAAHRGNVRIDVRFKETGATRESGAALRGGGDVVIGPNGVDGSIVLQPEIRHTVTQSDERTVQSLLTASGREAVLRVGEEVPYAEWIMEYGWQGGYVASKVRWQEVGSFLVVRPTIMGDGDVIHVELIPELRGLVDGQPHRTRFSELATSVWVSDGETVSLGGAVSDQTFYSRFLVGARQTGEERALDIELTPRIMPMRPAP